MQFENWSEVLNMGGHGAYVWSSYLLGVAILAWNLFAARSARRRFLADEARRIRRDGAREVQL